MLDWVFPFNIFLQQKARNRELEMEADRLRGENKELRRQLLRSAIENSTMAAVYSSSIISMQGEFVRVYDDALKTAHSQRAFETEVEIARRKLSDSAKSDGSAST